MWSWFEISPCAGAGLISRNMSPHRRIATMIIICPPIAAPMARRRYAHVGSVIGKPAIRRDARQRAAFGLARRYGIPSITPPRQENRHATLVEILSAQIF
jgi:hypothetical protein